MGGVCPFSLFGKGHHARFEIFAVDVQPRSHTLTLRNIARVKNHGVLMRSWKPTSNLLADADPGTRGC